MANLFFPGVKPVVALDLDDTLVATEEKALSVSFRILNEAREKAGLSPYPDDLRERYILEQQGKTMRAIIESDLKQDLLPFGDRPPAHLEEEVIDELVAKEQDEIIKEFKSNPPEAAPRVPEGLEVLKIGAVPIPIVTASAPKRAIVTLKSAGIYQFFKGELIISCQDPDAPRPKKPDPAAYLEAFDKTGAVEKFVVEDSPSGVEAGVAAGAVVIGNVSCKQPEKAGSIAEELLRRGAYVVVEDFRDAVVLVRGYLIDRTFSSIQYIRRAGRRVWVRD